MKTVFLHGLGQGPSSWDGVVRAMDLEDEALCPDPFGWLRGQEITYPNLCRALEGYCGELRNRSTCAACPWAGSWPWNTPSGTRKR